MWRNREETSLTRVIISNECSNGWHVGCARFWELPGIGIEKKLEESYGDWVKFRASIIARLIPVDLVKGDIIKTDTEYIF